MKPSDWVPQAMTYAFGLGGVARSVILRGETYLSPAKLKRLEQAIRDVDRAAVPGDVMEFGVARGGSAIVLAHHAKRSARRFVGFDVFSQIPAPNPAYDDEKSMKRFASIASGVSKGIRGGKYYGYEENLYELVMSLFDRYGLPATGNEICLEKGLFEDTVPKYHDARVAMAHVDCDWYEPVAYCLEYLCDRLAPGGVIVLDDYNDYGGCRSAVDQFRTTRPHFEFEVGPNVILRKGL